MPFNIAKSYSYIPDPKGPVRMQTRSACRSRSWSGGTYFRSIELGAHTNQIKVGVFEDGNQGIFVEQNEVLLEAENVFGSADISLIELSLEWNEAIKIKVIDGKWWGDLYSIRWQIGSPPPNTPTEVITPLGYITVGKLFIAPGKATFILRDAPVPGSLLELRPRTHRVTLATLEVTDPTTSMVTQGWDIDALRAADKKWVEMPARAPAAADGTPLTPGQTGADVQDDQGPDAAFLTAFPMTYLEGGNGLPKTPAGMNQGPERTLIHLNYSETQNGSMGVLNQVFEWVGSSVTIGSWQNY